jgi:glycosyltransferase involved in cell wall biosynthesis
MKKRLVIWDFALDGFVFDNKANGIAVQLYFWSQSFVEHQWEVFAISHLVRKKTEGISFIRIRKTKLDIFLEWINILYVFLKVHPRLIVFRGADRRTYPIARLSSWFNIKFLFFAASDVNFVPGKELVHGIRLNRRFYQHSIKYIPYIIVQNTYQKETLLLNYGRDSLVLPNIWRNTISRESIEKRIDVLWISNFRRLKRAEWMVEIARNNPRIIIALVGRPSSDEEYFNGIKAQCEELPNVFFFGPLSFKETNSLVSESKLVACTSEFEGFPNTFLQAWAYSIPVVSTVNPSSVITNHNLGIVVNDCEEFNRAIIRLLSDVESYQDKVRCIDRYFGVHHSADRNYTELMRFIHEC